ncbi:MAG: 2-succinyl-5-enolpyruvyl-6-hydroxy-3-cyclohexene-1-carboxylic-acid synthase, partial [Muribaculaceae bacterium]|nr:2-succinyl-5-enolpyruvyl-6-hydroxy-3-cyclohexene-1-carboxylic-acid synthase [Muribaculaceae bacterium]
MTIERERSHAIAALLAARGINEIVVSPGSRNAPLIEAIARESSIKKTVVIDERSAAFVALGKASVLQQCVALLCTSGTALLNYAPALAEARYRNIPLLAITADRAHEWINRNDAQTIEQQNVYANFIKRSFSIDARDGNRHISL